MDAAKLLRDLPDERVRLIEKYRLVPKLVRNRVYWVREFQGKPDHPYVTHRAMQKCHIIELVFSIYDLCVAKMTYFKKNIHHYEPCRASWRIGDFERCELWDMEFLVQRGTGIAIDLRRLSAINDINVFREMCAWLEQKADEHGAHEEKSVTGTLPNTLRTDTWHRNHTFATPRRNSQHEQSVVSNYYHRAFYQGEKSCIM